MNLQPLVNPKVTPRRITAFLLSRRVIGTSIFLLNTGALTAAPTPTPKPTTTPVATATVTPMPSASPVASATATPTPQVASYSGTQQMQYLSTAGDAFVAQRQAKAQVVLDATKAFDAAGGINPKGLNSKAAIAARRDIIAKCIAANSDYIAFIQTQDETYRAELAKTPLTPADIASVVNEFNSRANTAGVIKLRENERDTLMCGDDMLACLDKSYGNWSVSGDGKLAFKKKSDVASYNMLSRKFNKLATDQTALRAAVNGAGASASAAPVASVPPAASPAATATPAAQKSVK